MTPKSNVTIQGAGRGRSTLIIDDYTATSASDGITNFFGGVASPLSNVSIKDLTVKGMRGSAVAAGRQMLRIGNATNLSILDSEFVDSRSMGMVVTGSTGVLVRNNRVLRTTADGIAVWDTADAQIIGNFVSGAKDDSISVHSSDAATAPVRSGVVIANNLIEDGQGIACLGAKTFSIVGNILKRVESYGIYITFGNGFAQGHTPLIASTVADNTILDVFQRGDTGTNREQYYMRLGGSPKQAGTGASAPGVPVSGTGIVTNLYGTATGNFYVNNQSADNSVPSPGGFWLRVTNNIFARTLPAVTTWSQWGYGAGLPVGANGTWNGAVSEAMLNTRAMYVEPGLRYSLISGNTFHTTGNRGIEFTGTISDLDFDGLEISRNRFVDWTDAAIFWPTSSTSYQRIRIDGNDFDGDPNFRSANRGAAGTWLATGYPTAVYGANLAGAYVVGNHFHNVATPAVLAAGLDSVADNVVYGTSAALGFSVSNAGVGDMGQGPASYRIVTENSDPASSGYGKIMAGYTALSRGVLAGTGNTATGTDAGSGGTSSVATGPGALAFGLGNTASGAASAVLGRHARDFGVTSKFVFGSERIAAAGDSQFGVQTLHTRTTSTTAQRLLADNINGSGATAGNSGMVQGGQAMRVRGWVTAIDTVSYDTASWTVDFAIKRGATTATTAMVGTPSVTKDYADSAASAWTVTATADSTLGSYNISATGATGRTIDWVFTPLSAEVQ